MLGWAKLAASLWKMAKESKFHELGQRENGKPNEQDN